MRYIPSFAESWFNVYLINSLGNCNSGAFVIPEELSNCAQQKLRMVAHNKHPDLKFVPVSGFL